MPLSTLLRSLLYTAFVYNIKLTAGSPLYVGTNDWHQVFWVVVVLLHIVMYFCCSNFKSASKQDTGPKMALLLYTEMAWVIASPCYLCSHTNILQMTVFTYLLLQTSKQMIVNVNYILNRDELINHLLLNWFLHKDNLTVLYEGNK